MMLFFSRINPTAIIVGHFRTFYDASSNRVSWVEVTVLALVVAGASVGTLIWSPTVSDQFANGMLNFYAIVGGFLISALFIIVSYGDAVWANRASLPAAELERAGKLQREIFSNVSFGVLVAFVGAAICALLPLGVAKSLLTAALAGAFVLFAHTLLMVVKRLDVLFRKVTG